MLPYQFLDAPRLNGTYSCNAPSQTAAPPSALDIFVGKTKTQFEIFFVLLFLMIFIFLWLSKILFLAFSFVVVLHFSSAQVPRDEKYKIAKNENTKNEIFACYKKIKALKNNKTKNISSAFS